MRGIAMSVQTVTVPAAAPAPTSSVTVDPAAVAAAMDPVSVAAHIQQPEATPFVRGFERLMGTLDGVVVSAALLLAVFLLMRLIQSWMLHRAINRAIDAKSDVAPILVDKVDQPFRLSGPGEMPGDDRNGLVLVAIGLAMAGFGTIQGDEDVIRIAAGAALFPLFVGIALLVRRRLVMRAIAKELAAEQG
jgi:hypothetical protein